jgi:hypothetical protein
MGLHLWLIVKIKLLLQIIRNKLLLSSFGHKVRHKLQIIYNNFMKFLTLIFRITLTKHYYHIMVAIPKLQI